MTWLLAFIPKPVMAGLILALAIATGVQTCTVRKQAGEVAKARVAVDAAKTVNDHNLKNINNLAVRLDESVAGRIADETAHKTAVDKFEVDLELLEVRANDAERNQTQVYQDPTCADLAKINITAVCPAFVTGMRQRADSLNKNRNTGSTGTGTNAASD